MLTQIHITNLATIAELNLELTRGTTVITGETGAGKSILIDAIELAFGKRAAVDMVRSGAEKAEITICFDVQSMPEVQQWLQALEIDDTEECIIRRTINKDGRSRSYINNLPTTIQALREISEQLIDIHGQHEHQSLLKADTQRQLLDAYAGHATLVTQVRELSQQWHRTHRELNHLRTQVAERDQRRDFLRYQLQDLEALHLTSGEYAQLEQDHKQLANAAELITNTHNAIGLLAENETTNIHDLLSNAVRSIEQVQQIDPRATPAFELLNTAAIQLTEATHELRDYVTKLDLDPKRLQQVEQRLSSLFDLARKHKTTPEQLIDYQNKLTQELQQLENSDANIQELEQRLTTLTDDYKRIATQLSKSRQKMAKKLTLEITAKIHELGMPNGQFTIQINPEPENIESGQIAPTGLEKIEYWVTTNPGLAPQPLNKIASGGELSRISLAIHVSTAQQYHRPTLVFDEVDVGIGGGIAEIVGKQLRDLGNTHQVLCITHLPQVAAKGQQHLLVEKTQKANTTFTQVHLLNEKQKIAEIARMLGGVKVTQKTLEHAKEMLE